MVEELRNSEIIGRREGNIDQDFTEAKGQEK